MKRIPLIAGNWKMYKTGKEAIAYVHTLASLVASTERRVFLAVPFTAIALAVEAAKQTKVQIGGQNMHEAKEGAFTGEISATMLKEAGASFVLLGHSERRQYFHESNAFINKKVKRALQEKLLPVLCIGESEQQRVEGKTSEVLKTQISECLDGLSWPELREVLVAYEPIWAIGTGRSANPQQAQEVHKLCRDFVQQKWGREASEELYFLYGGSVKPDNMAALMAQPDIDGVLVGGASLDPQVFAKIINYSFQG